MVILKFKNEKAIYLNLEDIFTARRARLKDQQVQAPLIKVGVWAVVENFKYNCNQVSVSFEVKFIKNNAEEKTFRSNTKMVF